MVPNVVGPFQHLCGLVPVVRLLPVSVAHISHEAFEVHVYRGNSCQLKEAAYLQGSSVVRSEWTRNERDQAEMHCASLTLEVLSSCYGEPNGVVRHNGGSSGGAICIDIPKNDLHFPGL